MKKPIYLFTGFLEAGKTTFISKTITSMDMKAEQILLVGEDGEGQYESLPDHIHVISVRQQEDLNESFFEMLTEKYDPQQIFVEANGMWKNTRTYLEKNLLQSEWQVFQTVCIIDAGTFYLYLKNMPQFIMEKIITADMILFNRCTEELAEKLRNQKLRISNRKADFYLEFSDKRIENYKKETDHPVNVSERIICVSDENFAEWYVDILDDCAFYKGKIIKLRGIIHIENTGVVLLGHWVMTCCEADMQYFGVILDGRAKKVFSEEDEAEVTGVVKREYSDYYKGMGHVVDIIEYTVLKCDKPRPKWRKSG